MTAARPVRLALLVIPAALLLGCGAAASPPATAPLTATVAPPTTTPAPPDAPTGSGTIVLPPVPPASASDLPLPTKPGAPPATGEVFRLGPNDDGKSVRLGVGDRLIVTLSANRLGARWTLTDYPAGALRTDLRTVPLGSYGFVAQTPGTGRVELTRTCGGVVDRTCPSATTDTTWTATVTVS